jgi:hypothetical protein
MPPQRETAPAESWNNGRIITDAEKKVYVQWPDKSLKKWPATIDFLPDREGSVDAESIEADWLAPSGMGPSSSHDPLAPGEVAWRQFRTWDGSSAVQLTYARGVKLLGTMSDGNKLWSVSTVVSTPKGFTYEPKTANASSAASAGQ